MAKYYYSTSLFLLFTLSLFTASPVIAGTTTLMPRLSVSEEYTDNLLLENDNNQEEFTTIISPGFDLSAATQQTSLNFSYTAEYTIYSEYDNDPFLGHNSNVSFIATPSKHTQLSFQNFFLWTKDQVQESDFSLLGYVEYEGQLLPVLDTTIRMGLNEYITDTASGNVTNQFGEKNSISLNGLFSLRDEIDSDVGNDNRRYVPSLNLEMWLVPSFGFDFSSIYTRGEFDNSSDFDDWQGIIKLRQQLSKAIEMFLGYNHTLRRYTENVENDYDKYDGSMGITFQNDTTSLTLGGGYFIQDFLEGEDKDEEGLYFSGSVNKTWKTPRSTTNMVGSAGLERNEFGTENLGLERYYGLSSSISYRLTMLITANANASARISEPINTANGEATYRGTAGCGLTYVVRPWLAISTTYRHNLLRGRDEGNYEENSAFFTVSFTPQGLRYN